VVDDEHLLLRDDGDHRRRRHSTNLAAARPHLEHRWVVRVALREDSLDGAVTAARK